MFTRATLALLNRCIAWTITRSRNWSRCFDLSSSGTSTTQVRSERETENHGVTENFVFVSCGTAVQLERHEKIRDIFCGTAVQLECHEKKHNIFCRTAVCIQVDYTIAHSVLWYCYRILILLQYCTVWYCIVELEFQKHCIVLHCTVFLLQYCTFKKYCIVELEFQVDLARQRRRLWRVEVTRHGSQGAMKSGTSPDLQRHQDHPDWRILPGDAFGDH